MSRLQLEALPTAHGIAGAIDSLSAFLEAQGVETRPTHHACMLVEELLTNIGTHGGAAQAPAGVSVTVEPDRVTAEIKDRGRPFDPRSLNDPDFSLPAEERPEGGLGLFLVRKFSSALDYESADGENRTRFTLMRRER